LGLGLGWIKLYPKHTQNKLYPNQLLSPESLILDALFQLFSQGKSEKNRNTVFLVSFRSVATFGSDNLNTTIEDLFIFED
jgi:hypothetical protein